VRKLAVLSAMQLGRGAVRGDVEQLAVEAAEEVVQQQQQVGGWARLLPGLFGAANKLLSQATSSFIGQVTGPGW